MAVPASMLAVSAARVSAVSAAPAPATAAPVTGASGPNGPDSGAEMHHDTSRPLRSIAPSGTHGQSHAARHAYSGPSESSGGAAADTSGQRSATRQIPTTSTNFDGIGANGSAPPDNEGAIGTTQYVELVNQQFEVFSKSGGVVLSARNTNTLFSGFGGGCQTNNDGDGTVLWDSLAQRWVLQQFSVSTTPYLDCVAISTSADATGTWNRYSFQFSNFPDYPKMGVWPDAYYASFNLFNAAGTLGLGAELCAFNRSAMLTGAAASAQCFMATTSGESTSLPATIDGPTPPPAGAPEWFVALSPSSANALAYWQFHVDWSTPANSTLSSQATLPVAAFSQACGGGTCIPQSGTTQNLDSLGDRLMYRLSYRNFGDHEAMVVNHAVASGSTVGERWYELRPSGSLLSVFQQGTYAPDATYRWMGSIALDQSGDMALGFSASSGTLHPGIRYTGRLASDAAGTMPQGESTIITGGGSQSGQSLSRWGDYTEMTVDPVDQCTFWYVNEYEATTGAFNWSTRIGSFKFPSCGGTVTNDFSMAANPTSVTVTQGNSGTSTISTATTSGSAQTVTLTASGSPAGASASLNPASVNSGASSTLTLTTNATTPAGTYTITITGTGTSATHTTTVSLTVNPTSGGPVVTNGGFETGNFSGWTTAGPGNAVVTGGHSGTYAARVGSTGPASGDSTVQQTVTIPAGSSQLTFWYQPHCTDSITYDWERVQIRNTSNTVLATPLNVCSNSGAWTPITFSTTPYAGQTVILVLLNHDDNYPSDPTYTLFDDVAVGAVSNDFSMTASPTSVTVTQGNSGTSTISTATTSGSAQPVSFSASGLPSGASAGFNPASVNSGASSTLTLTTNASTPTGTYTITITGTGTSATHTTTVSLTVNPTSGGPVVTNGGFETGTFAGWTTSGASESIVSGGHSGSWAARLGSTLPTNGDSIMQQTVTIPSSATSLSFWYKMTCPDTLTYDWALVQIRNASNAVLATPLAKTCAINATWVQVTYNVTALRGQTVILWFSSHDDNYGADPSFTLYDDIAVT